MENLVGYLNECHPNKPETFVALAYLSKQQNRLKDASLFAQQAMALTTSAKDKSHAALLRSLILIENKKFIDADQFLNNIILIDSQNVDAYELQLRSYLQRNLKKEAKSTGHSCLKNIGNENPRSLFIYAQSIFSDPTMKDEFERRIKQIVDEFPYLSDAILLLAKFYDREQRNYADALKAIKKASQVSTCLFSIYTIILVQPQSDHPKHHQWDGKQV